MELLSTASSAHTEAEAVSESWRPPDFLAVEQQQNYEPGNVLFISAEDRLSAWKNPSQGEDSSKHQHVDWVTKLLFLLGR